jgi:hypothetical protein
MAIDPSEFEQRQRAVNEKILDRVSTDAAFKDLILSDPDRAMDELGVKEEIQEFQRIVEHGEARDPEVVAHHHLYYTRTRYCTYWSAWWKCGY